MKEEKILTLHPDRKMGVNILKRRYDVIKDFIINTEVKNKIRPYSVLSSKKCDPDFISKID
jgi:hypothetical protein